MFQREVLSWEAFRQRVAEVLQIDLARVEPDAYFITDLGVDSIRLVEVLLTLEQMGVEVSLDGAWRIDTVGSAYRYYREQVAGTDR